MFLLKFLKSCCQSEENLKLLIEIVTYIAIAETVTSMITIETDMCMMHCITYQLHNLQQGLTLA